MREITGEELKELQAAGKKILVDYKAKWCVPCKQLIPRLTNMANEYNNIEFVAIDVDENMEHAMGVGVRSVPTVMVYDGDKLIDRSQGMQPDAFYKKILNDL